MLSAISSSSAELQSRLSAVVGFSADAILSRTIAGTITSWNASAERIFGYSAAEAIGQSIEMIIPPDQPNELQRLNAIIQRGETIEHYATERLSKAGGRIPIAMSLAPIKNAAGVITGAAIVCRDITAHKRIETALKESEAQLQFAMETLLAGTWELDLTTQTARRTLIHDQIFGYPELLPRWDYAIFLAHVVAEDRSEVDRSFRAAIAAGSDWKFECRIRRADGEVRWILVMGRQQRNSAGEPLRLVGVVQDITERKQAESALREKTAALTRVHATLSSSEQKLRGLYELSPLGIALTDMQGRYLEFNEAFRAICDYPAEELKQLDYWQLTPKIYAPDEARQLESLRKTGRYGPYEKHYRRRDGTLIPINLNGILITDSAGQSMIWSIVEDITERKRAEAALRSERQLVDALLDSLPDYIYFKDTASRFLRINPALAKCFGVSDPAQAVGKTDADFLPADHARKALADDQDVIRTGQPLVEIEEQIIQPDGSVRWELTTKLPLRDAAGCIIGICGITSDITKRKAAEAELWNSKQQLEEALAELRRTQLQLIQQEKLRGLGQMASGVAHDFNNALSPIIGFSEFLLRNPEKLADQALTVKWLTHIHTCATDAALVVRRMREFGRQNLGSNALTPVDLNPLVRHVIELTAPCWKDQAQASGCTIHIVTELQPVPLIIGEEFSIRELLTNLIFNAVDALAAGGTLTLGTAVAGEFVRIWVRDTGVGMTAETRQRCFEPFYTTKPGMKGSGLGLAMVHSIVQRHAGTVEIESTLGQGTTITIRLPISREAPVVKVPTVPAALAKSIRVLVVDDEPLLCEVVLGLLSRDGHRAAAVASGAAALARLKTDPFDLVITDKAMPEINGEQLAVAIHQGMPEMPIILMTGFGDIMKAGGEMPPFISTILSKPITTASFREALSKVFPAGGNQSTEDRRQKTEVPVGSKGGSPES